MFDQMWPASAKFGMMSTKLGQIRAAPCEAGAGRILGDGLRAPRPLTLNRASPELAPTRGRSQQPHCPCSKHATSSGSVSLRGPMCSRVVPATSFASTNQAQATTWPPMTRHPASCSSMNVGAGIKRCAGGTRNIRQPWGSRGDQCESCTSRG